MSYSIGEVYGSIAVHILGSWIQGVKWQRVSEKIVAPTMVALMAVASVGIVLIPFDSDYAMNISGKLCIVIPAFAGIH